MTLTDLLRKADAALGSRLEEQVVAHHRRRLSRIGHEPVLEAPAGGWAAAAPPPRRGNRLEVLVDGEQALARIAEAIEGARSSVWLAGWFFSADFRLRADRAETLYQLLARAAERVEVLLIAWAGAPVPLFHPDRGQVRDMRRALTQGTRVRVALDARERLLHCHHEKLVIV